MSEHFLDVKKLTDKNYLELWKWAKVANNAYNNRFLEIRNLSGEGKVEVWRGDYMIKTPKGLVTVKESIGDALWDLSQESDTLSLKIIHPHSEVFRV